MCRVWLTDSSDFFCNYEKDLIIREHSNVDVEQVEPYEAINRILKHDCPDIVITDTILVGIGGVEFVNEIRKLNPAIKCIVVASDDRGTDELKINNVKVVTKPILVSVFIKLFNEAYNSVL